MPEINLREVLERVAKVANTDTDKALAAEFGVPFETLSTWKKRNKIPFEQLCDFAQRREVSLDYLLLGKKDTRARINIDLFKGIRRALCDELRDALSKPRHFLNDEDIDNYTLDFYNEAISIDDPLLRMRTITRSVVLVSREKLKELVWHLEWHVQNFEKFAPGGSLFPEFNSIEDAQKKLSEIRKRIEEFDAFLRSPSAQSIDDIRKDIAATKPEATRAESSPDRVIAKNRGRSVSGHGAATKVGKKIKKK